MTDRFKIRLRDHDTIEVTAHECSTRGDGSLWLLQHVEPSRQAQPQLVPVLILAVREWTSVWPADAPNPFEPPAPPPEAIEPPPSRLLAQADDIADPLARHAIVAAKLAMLPTKRES